ncbi:hypothetical protein ACM26V_17375 [Salipaludibacillus sp. HK11]|uniref:hypothetical protein n=1 Tax=Salipaludibacillus sp. HK11 TaxID=3394320 RepID=UPI0039FC9989
MYITIIDKIIFVNGQDGNEFLEDLYGGGVVVGMIVKRKNSSSGRNLSSYSAYLLRKLFKLLPLEQLLECDSDKIGDLKWEAVRKRELSGQIEKWKWEKVRSRRQFRPRFFSGTFFKIELLFPVQKYYSKTEEEFENETNEEYS